MLDFDVRFLSRPALAFAFAFALALALSSLGCGSACPNPEAPDETRAWEAKLDARTPIALDPAAKITVKEDVHSFEISVSAEAFTEAFHRVMIDPTRHFALIRVDRKTVDRGNPFAQGQRFQGRYDVQKALTDGAPAWEKKVFGDLAEDDHYRKFICAIENSQTSDYGEIVELALTPNAEHHYVMKYVYLDGSPIAGSSTFEVAALTDSTCLATQTFQYQEQTALFEAFFKKAGLELHNQVVKSQIAQAAEEAGGKVTDGDAKRKP